MNYNKIVDTLKKGEELSTAFKQAEIIPRKPYRIETAEGLVVISQGYTNDDLALAAVNFLTVQPDDQFCHAYVEMGKELMRRAFNGTDIEPMKGEN